MKKSVMMIPLLSIAVIVTILFGRRYAAAQSEDMDVNQVSVSENDSEAENDGGNADNQKEEKVVEDSSKGSLENYEANSENLSFYEYLDYISLKNEQVTLAYYGDINTDETWVSEVNKAMSDSVSGKFRVIDHSYPSYDTYELYIEQTAQAVIDEKPDVILYALPALPDKMRDMGLTETEEFMGYVLDRLSTLEDTKVVLLEPYPIPGQISQLNSRSLDYKSYLTRMQTVSDEYGLTRIPLHSKFTDAASEESLESYYEESDELNEAGTQQVITLLDALFSEEM